MTIVVLLILAILWGVVLVPPLLRARGERSRSGIGSYTNRLRILHRPHQVSPVAGTAPLATRPPATRPPARVSPQTAKRRRDVLSLLAMVALVSLAGAATTGESAIWALFALTAMALGGYVYAMVTVDRELAQRAERVRYLPPPRPAHRVAVDLRRTAGS